MNFGTAMHYETSDPRRMDFVNGVLAGRLPHIAVAMVGFPVTHQYLLSIKSGLTDHLFKIGEYINSDLTTDVEVVVSGYMDRVWVEAVRSTAAAEMRKWAVGSGRIVL